MSPMMRVVTVVLLALMLGACARGTGDLERWVAEVLERDPDPIDPVPPIQTPEVVAYNAMDLRDPFQSTRLPSQEDEAAAEEDPGEGLRPDFDRRKEYLEGFPLDTLAMVGTIQIDDVEFALIQDNESVVHRVREGNYLGQNHGLVTEVRSSQVEVRELVQDGRGVWVERRVRVTMAED